MTALIIIIFILQLVLVAWAAGITALYFQLVRTIRKLSAADQEAFAAIFENESDVLHAVRAALKTVEAVENEATAYKEAIDEELEKSRTTSDFALKTIQEARRIYRQATEVAGSAQPADSETFVQQIREKIQEDADGEQ